MNRKKSLSSVVRNTIEAYPYIRSSLSDGLVNYSALARKFKSEIDFEVGAKTSEESLVVSIKRYADELQHTQTGQDIPEIISNTTISTTEDVACVILESTQRTLEELKEIFQSSEWNLDEIRIIMQAASKVFVLLNKDKMKDFAAKMHDKEMMLKTDIAMVSVKIPTGYFNVYGLMHEFTSAFAKKGINIDAVMTLSPHLHFVIDEAHSNQAHEAIKELINLSKEIVKKRKSF